MPTSDSDIDLARRLERAEGLANAACVEARRRADPASGATWITVAGAHAMFDGVGSPLTQSFGVGVFEPVSSAEFAAIEEFFRSRGSPAVHEICALAAEGTRRLLGERGYEQVESSTVLVRQTDAPPLSAAADVAVRPIEPGETAMWARTSALGWGSESAELAAFVEGYAAILAATDGVTCFLAEIDGQPTAAAALNMSHGVAILAGASTIPSARRRGAQRALLSARLAFAAARGIDLAMIVTAPGSASQRNAERQGFRRVYGRSKWQLP